MGQFELLIATRNEGKVNELREAFAGLPATLRFLPEFTNISEVAEIGKTYEENATLKAAGYYDQIGIIALADDSGLEVDALSGGPGVLSAHFGGDHLSDVERTRALLTVLDGVAAPARTARFVSCMVLYGTLPGKPRELLQPQVLAITHGVCEGSLVNEPMGSNGFGFDPIFIPDGYHTPFAALDQVVKRKISHRARAAELMRQQLEQRILAQT